MVWIACADLRADAGDAAAPFDVLLTCYTLFERDSEEQKLDRAFLKRWPWSTMVLDEAHALKNRAAQRTVRLNRRALLPPCPPPPASTALQEVSCSSCFHCPVWREEWCAKPVMTYRCTW